MVCGNTQGPFTNFKVGVGKIQTDLFTCPIPLKKPDGKRTPDSERRELAMACNNRREKRDAAAQKNNPVKSGEPNQDATGQA